MKRYGLLLVFLMGVWLPTRGMSQIDRLNDKQRESLEKVVQAFSFSTRAPGFTIAIGQGDQIVLDRAWGLSDLENDVPAVPETRFRTASIAKSMTAVAVLQLVQQGKLGLDDPISQHCPEYPKRDVSPTIRQLLCHQGGVRHYKNRFEPTGTRHFDSIADSLELFVNDELLFEPGERFSYTTFGYSLLGRAIETASGETYEDYMHQHVFGPAGMDGTAVDHYWRIIAHRSRGYQPLHPLRVNRIPQRFQKDHAMGTPVHCSLHDTSMKIPGGGLVSTSGDLVRFAFAVMDERLIDKATRDVAWTAQTTNDGTRTGYGLGWAVSENEGIKTVSHSGGQAGTATYLLIRPDARIVVAVMCNMQGAPCGRLASSIAEIMTESPDDR